MERLHIAVFTPLVTGHVYPALGLCSELMARGHRVTFPTDEVFAARIRQAGAEAIGSIDFRAPSNKHAENETQHSSSEYSQYWEDFVSATCPMLTETAAATVAELGGFYEANRPDVILYEWFSFAGRILAKRLGCPAIQICSHFAHPRDSVMRVDGICTNPDPMLKFGESIDALMSRYGFKEKGHLWHVEKMNLFFIPREFQYDADSFDDRFIFVGATHNRKSGTAVWKNEAANGKPILLISENTGSTDDEFLKLCVRAFGDSQYYVVFSKGLHSPEVSFSPLPGNFEINRKAYNRDILPFADVLLCQGGMGTTLESLYHGVPVVAVPSNPFNAEVTYRVAEMGLGIHIPERSMTSSALRQAVDTASFSEALRRRVKNIQRSFNIGPKTEVAVAADAIEEFLTST